jgi:hypothetical protein
MNDEKDAVLIKLKDGNEFIVDNFKSMSDHYIDGMVAFTDRCDNNELWISKDQISYVMAMHGRTALATCITKK